MKFMIASGTLKAPEALRPSSNSSLDPALGPTEPPCEDSCAKALDNAGMSAEAAGHLKPLLQPDGLLAHDPVAHTTYTKALDNAEQGPSGHYTRRGFPQYLMPTIAA